MFEAIENESDTEIQMAPLIDCVFLLLIFFLVATTLKEQKRELPLDLPDAVSAVSMPQEAKPFVISVDKGGKLYLGGDPVSVTALHNAVRESAAADPDQRVRVDLDKATPGQYIVQVLDLCNFEGLSNVGIRIAEPR